jgi:hypothetical protein
MPRQSIFQTAAILCLICLQVWLVYRIETLRKPATDRSVSAARGDTLTGSDAGPLSNEQTALLMRIDARLATLEHARSASLSPSPSPPSPPVVAGSPEASAADRTLAAMLPQGPITDQQLMMLQAQIGQLPSDDYRQVSAALARAINSGRVQIRPQ